MLKLRHFLRLRWPQGLSMPEMTSAEAINDALAVAGINEDVVLLGEGIDDVGAFYGTTNNLRPIYGNRLIEMPISESAMMGVAIGLAMSGKRPVISFHRVEFALLAMEQIINNAAKMHYTSNGQHKCPLVIRMIVGRGWGQGPTHSQSLESMFAAIPGLKVLMPSLPSEYKGMLIAAIEDDNPVVIIEHRWTHYTKAHVEPDYYTVDISQAVKERCGQHCTVVASSYNTLLALRAAEALDKIGIQLEVIGLRSIRPLDMKTIRESAVHTGHLLTLDVGHTAYGIGAEIIAQIAETLPDVKVSRIGMPDHPVPSSRGYLPGLYPDIDKIVNRVCDMLYIVERQIALDAIGICNLPLDIPDPSFQGPF